MSNFGIKSIWSGGGADLTALQNQVNSLAQIAAKTNIANTFTANQIINGQLKLTSQANALAISKDNDKYITFNNARGSREVYIGRGSSSSSEFQIVNEVNNANMKIQCTGDGYLGLDVSRVDMRAGSNIKTDKIYLGFGGNPQIVPDEGTNKVLRFKDGNNRKFAALDMTNDVKVINLANLKNSTSSNINNNASGTVTLPANSIVFMVRRSDTGILHTNWSLTNAGQLSITNNTGANRQFLIAYWEV